VEMKGGYRLHGSQLKGAEYGAERCTLPLNFFACRGTHDLIAWLRLLTPCRE
jgi:hypothetical protein